MNSRLTQPILHWNQETHTEHYVDNLILDVLHHVTCISNYDILDTIIKESLIDVDINYICHKLNNEFNHTQLISCFLVYMANYIECVRKIPTISYKCKIYTHNTCVYAIIHVYDKKDCYITFPYYCLCDNVLYGHKETYMVKYIREYIVNNSSKSQEEICYHIIHNLNSERVPKCVIELLIIMVLSIRNKPPKSAMTCVDNTQVIIS